MVQKDVSLPIHRGLVKAFAWFHTGPGLSERALRFAVRAGVLVPGPAAYGRWSRRMAVRMDKNVVKETSIASYDLRQAHYDYRRDSSLCRRENLEAAAVL